MQEQMIQNGIQLHGPGTYDDFKSKSQNSFKPLMVENRDQVQKMSC